MNNRPGSRRFLPAVIAFAALIFAPSTWAKSTPSTAPAGSPCANIPHPDHPKAFLTNGVLDAVIFLPNAKDGYYRGSRFDWAGVVSCLSFQGHTYFGEWFQKYDPLIADAITGPVEEFTSAEGAIGYTAAKAGGSFVKIGVGVLRKPTDDAPYRFMTPYQLIDGGKRTTKIKRRSITFTQRLRGPNGIAYLYTKTLSLDNHGAFLSLQHSLKNIGSVPINTEVYDHDFFMIDRHPTSPDMVVHFAFEPRAEKPLEPLATIRGHDLVFLKELGAHETAASFLTGYSDQVTDYRLSVENRESGAGVEQSSDTPISKFNFWSPRTTICPEAYVHLSILPGQTAHYTIRYHFFSKSTS